MAKKMSVRDRHRIVATCIPWRIRALVPEYLLLKNSPDSRAFPGAWKAPGGELELDDYCNLPQTSPDGWEDPAGIALRREIFEEARIRVGKFEYLSNVAFIGSDGLPTFGIRFAAPYRSGTPQHNRREATDIRWMGCDEACDLPLLGNLKTEIPKLDARLRGRS